MPNTREKLIDLIIDAKRTDPKTGSFTEYLADRLIANGVTVQQWIPVDERMPEDCDSYIVVVKYKYDHEKEYDYGVDVATYYTYDNPDAYIDNHWDTYNDWYEGQQYIHITHWMPLPKQPKDG